MQLSPFQFHDFPVVLRLPVVRAVTGYSTSTIYRLMAEGKFPRQIALGPKSVGWLALEIQAWLEARIANRDADVAAPKP